MRKDEIEDDCERTLFTKQVERRSPITGYYNGIVFLGENPLEHLLHAWIILRDENGAEVRPEDRFVLDLFCHVCLIHHIQDLYFYSG
jgi:hypothetical protein